MFLIDACSGDSLGILGLRVIEVGRKEILAYVEVISKILRGQRTWTRTFLCVSCLKRVYVRRHASVSTLPTLFVSNTFLANFVKDH